MLVPVAYIDMDQYIKLEQSDYGYFCSLLDDKVTMWRGVVPPGKPMELILSFSGVRRQSVKEMEDIKEVFAAVRPDGIVHTQLFLTEEECLTCKGLKRENFL